MKIKAVKIVLILCLVALVNSCQKIESYPPEPYIEFISMEFKSGLDEIGNPGLIGTLRFYFRDGDGDIGFIQSGDTAKPKQTIFIDKYKMVSGELIFQDYEMGMSYSIPYFTTGGKNTTLEGEMIVRHINIYGPSIMQDTILFEFFIVDRAGNKSNVENTGLLILKEFQDN